MPRPPAPVRRSPNYAWLITGPLIALSVVLSVPVLMAVHDPFRYAWWSPIFIAVLTFTIFAPLRLDMRRQGYAVLLTDIPLLLALFFLSPLMVLGVRVVASIISHASLRLGWAKAVFNVAATAAATAAANVVVYVMGPHVNGQPAPFHDAGLHTWIVLAVAVFANFLVAHVSIGGVILLMQGVGFLPQFWRSTLPAWSALSINVDIALIMLLTIEASKWAGLLLGALAVVLVLVYRAYAQFLDQHKRLTELYDLAKAVGGVGAEGSLPDVLIGRVRTLLHAESATLWLANQGRHDEVLLSSQLDYPGLLDKAPLPDAFRQRAMTSGQTIVAGPRTGTEEMRAELRAVGVSDAVVVPLKPGNVTIGTIEVADRLTAKNFNEDDVRLLETLAAQVGTAVENSRLVDRLRFDADHDPLTTLPNRRRMLEAFGEAIRTRSAAEVVAVLVFDVVGLRQVNDSLGHAAGDKVLAEVARQLRALAPPEAMVARIGGDKFAVELRKANADEAVTVGKDLRANLRARMVIETLTVEVDTNVGVALHPDHGSDPETLLQRADVAAHVARSRGIVQLFNAGLESRSVRRLGLAGDLRVALEAGELEVHFQPQISLRDRRLVGVECLSRWEHPVHGSVSPQDFVAVAEHTGQLAQLTETVLRGGLRRAREWAEAGRSLTVAVNISPRTLLESDFPQQVADLLAEHRVAGDRLTLEITEVALIAGDRLMPTLRRLRDLGVRLSVDDFGTGQSSLAHLRGLPVQEVKIDRTFVQGMATDPADLAIVRTIVDMARHFGLSVVAEGVESELTLGLLEDVGCDVGQGFLFSRALPEERFNAWLQVQEEADPAPAGELRWLRAVP